MARLAKYWLCYRKVWGAIKMQKYYYLWIGQNASTGTPNAITGQYSNYGKIIKFKTKALREEFDEQYRPNGYEFTCKVNRKTARQYCLGQSVRECLEYLDHGALEYFKTESGSWEAF
jgi:hypothetical protein